MPLDHSHERMAMKPKFKFRPKARLRVGQVASSVHLPIATKGAVRWKNLPVRSGRAFRVKPKGARVS
jgi:hypothetical protein